MGYLQPRTAVTVILLLPFFPSEVPESQGLGRGIL